MGQNMTYFGSFWVDFDPFWVIFGTPLFEVVPWVFRCFGLFWVIFGSKNGSKYDLFWVILGSFWVILAEIWSFWVILAKWPYWVPGGHGWPLVDCLVSGLGPPHDPLGPQIAKMTENDPFWPFLAWDPQNDPK